MWPANAGPPARDAASEGSEETYEKKSNRRPVRNDHLTAHPSGAFALSNPRGSSYDVRAAIRRRSARRDMIIRISVITTLLGVVLCVLRYYLL